MTNSSVGRDTKNDCNAGILKKGECRKVPLCTFIRCMAEPLLLYEFFAIGVLRRRGESLRVRSRHFFEIYNIVDGNRKESVIFLDVKKDVTRISVDIMDITHTGDIGAAFFFGIGNKVSDGD